MVNIRDCNNVKEVRNELNKLALLVILILPTVYFGVYLNQNMEIPINCSFDSNFLSEQIQPSINTINGSSNLNISSFTLNSTFRFKYLEFDFHNYMVLYSELDSMNAYLHYNSTSLFLNSIIQNGDYIRRVFDLRNVENVNELTALDIIFKVQKNYRIFAIKLVLTTENDLDMNFYIFFNSDDTYKITNEKFIFSIIRIEYNIESILTNNLEINLEKQSTTIFELYNLQFR